MNYDSSGGAPHGPADISPLGAVLVSRLDAMLRIVAAADDGGDDNKRRLRGALTRAGDEARDGDLDRGCARYLLLVLCNAAYWLGRWGLPPPAWHVRPLFPSPSAAWGVREVAPVVGVPPAPSSAADSPVVLVADRHLPYGDAACPHCGGDWATRADIEGPAPRVHRSSRGEWMHCLSCGVIVAHESGLFAPPPRATILRRLLGAPLL